MSSMREARLARLRDALEQSRAIYEGAKDEHDSALARIRRQGFAGAGGGVLHAARVCDFTRKAYRQALREYTDFVRNGN